MKLFLSTYFFLITASVYSQGYDEIFDTSSLRYKVNQYITPNNSGSISAAKLNNLLNGFMNVSQFKIDSVYEPNDSTLRFVRGGKSWDLRIKSNAVTAGATLTLKDTQFIAGIRDTVYYITSQKGTLSFIGPAPNGSEDQNTDYDDNTGRYVIRYRYPPDPGTIIHIIITGAYVSYKSVPKVFNKGIFPSGETNDNKMLIASALGVGNIRSQVLLDASYNGSSNTISQFITSGFRNVLNVNERQAGPDVAYPSTTAEYHVFGDRLRNLLSQYSSDTLDIVSNNEPLNQNNHLITGNSDIDHYVSLTDTLISICHTKGFKVFDGATTTPSLVYAVYRWLANTGGDSTSWMNNKVPYQFRNGLRNRTSTSIEQNITYTNYYLTQLALKNIDAWNFHYYEPMALRVSDTSTVGSKNYTGIAQIVAFLKSFKNIPVITNEFAMLVSDTQWLQNVMNDMYASNVSKLVYFNTNDVNDTPLPVYRNGITLLGNVFKN